MSFKKFLLPGIAALSLLTLTHCGKAEPRILRVAVGATMPPFAYYHQGKIDGIEVAILREVARKNGYTLQFADVPFENLLEAVNQGKFAVAVGAISISESRKNRVDFSIPFETMPRVIVSYRRSPLQKISQLEEKRFNLGIQEGTTQKAYRAVAKHNVFEFPNYGTAIAAMLSGNLDGVLCDRGVAGEYAIANPVIVILPDALFVEEFGIAVGKQHPEIRKQLDDAITEMKRSGKLEDLKHQYHIADHDK